MPSHDQNLYLMGADICHSSCQTNCYKLKSLELDKRTTLVLSNTRKLDRELFYKLVYLIESYRWSMLSTVHPTLKQPYVVHKANMWCPCCMTSFVLKSSTKFFQVSWSILWLCYQVVTDVTVWPISPNPSCSKNRK